MENPLIQNTEIFQNHFLYTESIKKHLTIPPNIITQIQFLINRTDELQTVLKEIDEILNKIRKELLDNLAEGCKDE